MRGLGSLFLAPLRLLLAVFAILFCFLVMDTREDVSRIFRLTFFFRNNFPDEGCNDVLHKTDERTTEIYRTELLKLRSNHCASCAIR